MGDHRNDIGDFSRGLYDAVVAEAKQAAEALVRSAKLPAKSAQNLVINTVNWAVLSASRRLRQLASGSTQIVRESIHAATQEALVKTIRDNQEFFIFNPSPPVWFSDFEDRLGCKKVQAYAKDYPALASFQEKEIVTDDGAHLTLWYKPPKDKNQPVYVVFHGRTGHWGDVGGMEPNDWLSGRKFERHYRLQWLETLATEGGLKGPHAIRKLKGTDGAGVIAVHMRGYGRSRYDATIDRRHPIKPSEEGFGHDVKAVADFLLHPAGENSLGLDPNQIILTGESLGGAVATMLAEEMTAREQPPAVLGLLASFATMRDSMIHNTPHCLQLRPETVNRALEHFFNTNERLKHKLAAKLEIIHPVDDTRVPVKHAFKNQATARRHMPVHLTILGKEDMREGTAYSHISWKPEIPVDILRDAFDPSLNHPAAHGNGRKNGALFTQTIRNVNGTATSRNGANNGTYAGLS